MAIVYCLQWLRWRWAAATVDDCTLLPPTKEEVYAIARVVCLSACLLARLLKNACVDLDEMLHVNRCWDMDELINVWARSGL